MLKRLSSAAIILSTAWAFAPAQAATVFFSDNFPGSSLNKNNWSYCFPGNTRPSCSGGGNWPNDQWVPWAAQVNNSLFLYVAKGNTTDGRQYAASMVTSYGKFHPYGGWIQAEMKMPAPPSKTAGYWPAFWLLPVSYVPYNGKVQNWEIDCEWLGNTPNTVYFTLHGHSGNTLTQIAQFTASSNTLSSQFHDYTFNWKPGQWLEFRFDGAVIGRVNINVPNEPMFMVLNNDTMAENINWNGNVPNAETWFPGALVVRYVAVESN